ncbi:hypothetical protein GGR57DRAFT_496793 [Xylariaceae sp. FL1272]|nr:hypothetical protein GGR57DRAFT_496793 [Xylariaceae sp. FL1272]
MDPSLLQRLLKNIHVSVVAVWCSEAFTNARIGLLFMICVQFLVMALQIVFDLNSVKLPASIVVMLLVILSMIIGSRANKETPVFYENYLRKPTDFIGRHMSLGFVPFFILLNRDHVGAVSDILRLATAFIVTTTLSYVGSFLLATAFYDLEQRLRRFQGKASDVEGDKTWPSPSIALPAPQTQLPPKRISQLSSLSIPISMDESLIATKVLVGEPAPYKLDFVLRTAPASMCLFLITIIGIPIYLATGLIVPFEVFVFALLWVFSIRFQERMRSSYFPKSLHQIQSNLVILTNPLLLTAGLGTAYMWLKAIHTDKNISTVVGDFRHSTLSKSVINIWQDHDVAAHLGAGDLASLLLDAGVVSMGFKIFEYRSELLASLGTVACTCVVMASINLFLNVLIAHLFSLQASEAISFAARSTTIALGVPAVEILGGSTILMSTLAIFSGMHLCGYQTVPNDGQLVVLDYAYQRPKTSSDECSETSNPANTWPKILGHKQTNAQCSDERAIVAAGVTVGINAAALGVVFCIERKSRATAYSALSMIMFGAATVVLSSNSFGSFTMNTMNGEWCYEATS